MKLKVWFKQKFNMILTKEEYEWKLQQLTEKLERAKEERRSFVKEKTHG